MKKPHYDLGFYEAIIKEYVLDAKDRKISAVDFQTFQNALKDAAETTRTRMRRVILTRSKFRVYLSRHQTAIVELKDMMLQKMDLKDVLEIWEEGNAFLLKDVCKCIYRSLADLLAFIVSYFQDDVDGNVKVPEAKRLIAIQEHVKQLELIQKGFTKGGVSKELLAIVMHPLETLPEYRRLSYARLQYLQELTVELISIARVADDHAEGKLIDILLCFNFNLPEFLKYLIDGWRTQLEAIDHADGQLKWIEAQIADNQLRVVRTDVGLDKRVASVRNFLEHWLEMKRTAIQKIILPAETDTEGTAAVGFKFQSDMPVEQLAYYKHLEVLVNKRPRPNLTRYFESISANYSSVRQDNISTNNIRTAYYNVTKRHRERVEDRLFEMIKISKGFK